MVNKARTQAAHLAIERLTRLADLFQQRREQLAQSAGLTVSQWSVLEEIATEHFMPSMFAQSESTSRAAVSKVIRQLLDRGLIQVAISQHDGRQRKYAPTDAGKATLEKVRAERQRAIEAIWLPLNTEALVTFSEFSDRLIERIERFSTSSTHSTRSTKE